MALVQLETTPEQLLKAVAQLPSEELAAFVRQVMVLQAQRETAHLPAEESALLLQFNQGLTAHEQARYAELIANRKAETLSEPEYSELLALGKKAEAIQAKRLEALAQLAKLRSTPLAELMQTLGLKPSHLG